MALQDPSRDLRLVFDADAAREPARGSDLLSDSFATGVAVPGASSAVLAEAENWLLHEAEARARAEVCAAQAVLERAAMEVKALVVVAERVEVDARAQVLTESLLHAE